MGSWLEVVFKSPIIYHTLQCIATVHRDTVGGSVLWSACRPALLHKAEAIKEVHRQIAAIESLDERGVELLASAVGGLTHAEMATSDQLVVASPFIPLFGDDRWINVFGRAGMVQQHARAAGLLVARLGGIRKLSLPGMATLVE